jgi:hypothetical protein
MQYQIILDLTIWPNITFPHTLESSVVSVLVEFELKARNTSVSERESKLR